MNRTNTEIPIPHNTETVRDMLNTLNRIYGISWHRISAVLGVPEGTLWSIAQGGKIPHKWKRNLICNKRLHERETSYLRWAILHREEA